MELKAKYLPGEALCDFFTSPRYPFDGESKETFNAREECCACGGTFKGAAIMGGGGQQRRRLLAEAGIPHHMQDHKRRHERIHAHMERHSRKLNAFKQRRGQKTHSRRTRTLKPRASLHKRKNPSDSRRRLAASDFSVEKLTAYKKKLTDQVAAKMKEATERALT